MQLSSLSQRRGRGGRECCINPNRLVSITVKLLAQDHRENATLQKPRKQKHIWMIFDDRANIKFLTNSGFSCPDLVQVTIYGPKALTWLVCFPNSKAKSYDFLPAKTCQRPPEPWLWWLSTSIKIIFVSRKKHLQAKIAAWRSGDVGWATLSCRADDPI